MTLHVRSLQPLEPSSHVQRAKGVCPGRHLAGASIPQLHSARDSPPAGSFCERCAVRLEQAGGKVPRDIRVAQC